MATEVSLTGRVLPITIDQGSTFTLNFALSDENNDPLDMTGYDLRLQVRNTYSSTTTLLNCTLANSKLVWTSQVDGTFKLIVLPTDTSSLLFPKATPEELSAVYDLEVVSDTGVVTKPIRGTFTILREVTR